MDIIEQFLLFIASYIANAMSAFAGGGAGLVQLPAILLLGLPFPVALATHKVATVALGVGASYRYMKEKDLMELKFALYVLLFGMLGTISGVFVIINIPEHTAKVSLAIITIALGIYSLFKKELGETYKPQHRDLKGYIIGAIVIYLIGVFNGSLTSGSGLFVTLFLIIWFGLDYKRAVAYTLTLVGFFWNATGAVTLTAVGEPVHWPWIPVLLIASFLGGYTGAHFNTLKGNKMIKYAFVGMTLLSGVALLYKAYN